jgi:rsbT antagonist protein RsbS
MARTIPIIKMHDNLLVSIQVELSDAVVIEMKNNLAQEILRQDVNGLIIELSGVDTFDSYIACAIRDIAQIGRLMGVHTVVAGFDAAIATTLVEMGMSLNGVPTAASLEAALDMLAASARERSEHTRNALSELGIVLGAEA